MSRTLGRLRATFTDELLVRTVAGYELTPRARTLQDELAVLMPLVRSMVDGGTFDPATATGSVRLAVTDYGLAMVSEALVPTFLDQAPRMSLLVEPVTATTFSDVERGRVDLVLSPVAAPPPLVRQTLFVEDWVCLVARDHPLRRDRPTLEELISYPHASVSVVSSQEMLVESTMARLGVQPPPGLTVPYFSAAIAALPGTALIALVPRRLATRCREAPVRTMEAPLEFSAFAYPMVWHPRLSGDPEHRWLRSLLVQAGSALSDQDVHDPIL